MASGVSGPDGSGSGQVPEEVQTGMSKMYSSKNAPGFAHFVHHFWPDASEQVVSGVEQGCMQMLSNTINEMKTQHQKVQDEIKKRIDEG